AIIICGGTISVKSASISLNRKIGEFEMRKTFFIALALIAVLIAACGPAATPVTVPTPAPTQPPSTELPPPTTQPTAPAPIVLGTEAQAAAIAMLAEALGLSADQITVVAVEEV